MLPHVSRHLCVIPKRDVTGSTEPLNPHADVSNLLTQRCTCNGHNPSHHDRALGQQMQAVK